MKTLNGIIVVILTLLGFSTVASELDLNFQNKGEGLMISDGLDLNLEEFNYLDEDIQYEMNRNSTRSKKRDSKMRPGNNIDGW